jgi:hypothetical protein
MSEHEDPDKIPKKSGRIKPVMKTLADYLSVDATPSLIAPAFMGKLPEAAYNPGFPVGVDGVAADQRNNMLNPTEGIEDLSSEARETLASYAAGISQEVNKYYPNPLSTDLTPGHQKGDVMPKVTSDDAFYPTNSSADGISSLTGFGYESGGLGAGERLGSFFGEGLTRIINKVGDDLTGTPGPYDGNDILLKGVSHDTSDALIQTNVTEEIESVLQASNRYSPTSDFSADQTPYILNDPTDIETEAYSKGLYSIQTGTGIKGEYNKDAPFITVQGLTKLARELMVNASGHEGLLADGDSGSALANWAIMLPSLTQIGAGKVSVSVLRIKNTNAAKATEVGVLSDSTKQMNTGVLAALEEKLRSSDLLNEGQITKALEDADAALLYQSLGQDDIIMVQTAGEMFGMGADGLVDGLSRPMNASSYGTMNSFLEPFDGPMPMGMFMLTLYGLLGTALIGGIVETAISSGETDKADAKKNKAKKGMPASTPPRELGMGYSGEGDGSGESSGSIAKMFMDLFGIHECESSDYASAITRGLMAFYGFPFPPKEVTWEKAIDVALNIALSPGYYATITKQVLRDLEQVTDAAQGFSTGMSGLLAVTQVFVLVEGLFSSTTFKFINTMAIVGDIMHKAQYAGGSIYTGASVLKYEDETKTTGATAIMRKDSRSRFNIVGWNEVQKHTLRTYPSLLFTNQITDKFGGLNTFDASQGVPDEESGNMATSIINTAEKYRAMWVSIPKASYKLPPDLVRAVENAIDNEYMPFTIQDLRTNELISMPSFITSVSDSFAAEYTDSHGFGRTDPVKTYNKTTRSIDVTFRLAAQSKADHDYMWYVINRMVAMLYPQRSPGRKRSYDNGSKEIIQPFSQVPTASPMVRLRLGDLISSNYNKMGLGRLFGYPGRGFNTQTVTGKKAIEKRKLDEFISKKTPDWHSDALSSIDWSIGQGSFTGKIYVAPQTQLKGFSTKGDSPPPKDPNHTDMVLSNKERCLIEIVKLHSNDDWGIWYEFKFSMKDQTAAWSKGNRAAEHLFGKDASKWARDGDGGGRSASNKNAKFRGLIGVGFLEPKNATESLKTKYFEERKKDDIAAEDLTAPPPDTKDSYESFMSEKTNPIVKSFRSGMGRGLAGFITQMGLSYEGANWEIEKGSRAPTMVEIQMSFAPTHDLPLGLDATGRLSAASHPVGLVHTDPWSLPPKSNEPPEEVAGDPEGGYASTLQSDANAAADQRSNEQPNPVDAKPADPQTPPSPPGASLGGFDPASLMSAVGGLGALKGLF